MCRHCQADSIMKDYIPGVLENGGKMQILFTLIDESIRLGDKILVFSQSLPTLNLMEELLAKRDVPGTDEKWTKNRNYYSKLPFWIWIYIVTSVVNKT